ncbi:MULTISPECIES: MBG domain-containing protein [unclassified Faecalibacillus]|uniref:MBG domain-containing protein n=1 Tax=unclassified Faecalibacillus TaxID=2678890 RepID=UPI001D09E46B|nr:MULTISPECIES: MBG domain-containing protein [unclassified Faecalibacillus]MCB8540178.1 Ig-like domain-containing protein [Faecalibacillus sp. TM498]MCB8557891.1 Ig-like domain-containing protein [Faecalibacillus sp. TM111]
MKIKIKKIIASILTFMMIFTQVPVNVFAADTNISSDGSTYYTSTPGTYNLPGGTYYTKKYSTWENAGTKVRVQYNSSKIGTIALNILGDVINNPDKSGRFDFIRTDRNTDVTINMNGHTFTYSGNDVYSLCGFVENSGTMTINGSGGTIVSDEVGLNSKEGVLNVNDVTIKANRIGIYNEATVLKLKNVKFDESCGTDVQLGSNGTIDLSEYNGNAITIDIDYNINDGKKHRISPRGVSRDDLNKIKFVRNSDKLYRVDLRYDEEGQYIYLAKHVHKWNYVLDNSDESGKIIKGYCSEEDRKSECDYQDPDTTTAKIVLKTKDGGYKKGDNAWVENAAGNNTSSFPISGDSYKLTYYQNGQQLSQRPTEPGDYSVTLTMNQVSVSGEFTITKAEYYTNKIYFKDKNWKEQDNCKYTYQGYQSEFGPYVKVNDGYGHLMDPNYVDSNAVVSYEYKKCDDDDSTYKPISSDKLLAELNSLKPGTYYIRGVVSETNHYLRLTTKSLKFTVLKAEPTPPSIVKYTWEYGEQPELVPESMLDNCQYSYKYYYRDTNVKVNKEYPDVGKYYLSIYNSGSDLYKSGSSPQKFITITQRTATLSWKLDGTNTFKIPYDGKPHVPTATVTNTVGDDKCKVTVSGEQTEVGTYTATATELSDSNYKLPVQNTVTFEIVKAHREAPTSVTATGTTYKGGTDGKLNNVDSSMEYRKDGENEWRSITGDTVEGLSTGKYYVRYKDSNNYYASSEKEVYVANGQEIKVKVPASQVGYTLSVSNTVVDYNESSTLTFTLNKGYSKTKNFAVKVNGETVQLDNNNQYTINNIQKNTNITVEGVADITAPDTEIKVSNKTWKSILNKITFGLFFKETQKAEITATDEGSGVNKYYYYVDKSGSEKSLTEKQLQAVDWKEGTSVTFNEDSNYVIYAKVTDKAGNIKYVSTDGIVIDTIAPQVSGVENNQTYTKTQTFTVTDNNLDTVKVDGQTVEPTNGSYTLVPKKGTYTIEVTDKSGNKTTLNNITVNWEKVKKPTVESKVYTGQTLTANISENGLYTVKENNGGIDVNEYDVQLTLKDPTNYRWEDGTIDTTVKFNITQATPVVTKPTTKTLTYNGSEQELVNAASTNGGTVKYSLDNKNWSTSIPTGKAAKEYTVYYKVEGNKNFKDADVQEITNKINPRTIDLNWNKELTYNGKEQLPTATVNNLVDGDKCEITVDGDKHKNVGTYEAKATKVSNPNYKLPENVTTSYTIKPKDITVTITPNGGTYGEKITGATAKLNDVENGNHPEVTLTYTGTGYDGTKVNGTEVPSHAGKYTVTASIDDKNYNLTDTNTAEFVVKGADAGLKVKEVNDKKYGDQGFKLEVSHKGNGKLSYSSSNEDVATVDDQGNVTIHNAGTTKLKVTLGVDHNYDSDSKEVTLTVNKINHELTVDQKDVEKTYGDEAFTIHAQSKDNESAIEYASSDEKVATVDSEGNVVIKGAGKVIITVSQKESKNYKKISKEINLTVKAKKITVTVNDASKTYGDEDSEFTYVNDKLIGNDKLTGIILTREEGEDVGTYKIKVSQKEGSNPNYDITFKDGTYTINPLSIDKGTVVLGNVLKYTGEKQTQEVEQVLVNGKALNKEDYEVLDNQATKEGKHVLTIKAKGNNHTGSFEYAYVILPKENDKIGTGSFTVKTTGDVEISRDEIIDILIENKEITANELSEVAEGKKIEIVLEVKEAQANELIETSTKGYKVGKYLNITLNKIVNGTNESIHELSKVMKVTIKVPEELINKDSKTKREYYIARSHNGKVDILETIYNEKTNSLTFETDKFSDYAIIYKDKKELKTTVTTSINKSNTKQTTKAKTGDNANIIGLMMLLVSSMFVMVFVRKKEN